MTTGRGMRAMLKECMTPLSDASLVRRLDRTSRLFDELRGYRGGRGFLGRRMVQRQLIRGEGYRRDAARPFLPIERQIMQAASSAAGRSRSAPRGALLLEGRASRGTPEATKDCTRCAGSLGTVRNLPPRDRSRSSDRDEPTSRHASVPGDFLVSGCSSSAFRQHSRAAARNRHAVGSRSSPAEVMSPRAQRSAGGCLLHGGP